MEKSGCDPRFDWVNVAKPTHKSSGSFVTSSPDGVIFVAGSFQKQFKLGGTLLTGPGGEDMFFAAYNSQGVLLWANTAGGGGNDSITYFKYDPTSKSLIVKGSFQGDCVFENAYLRETTPAQKGKRNLHNFTAQLSLDGKFTKAETDEGIIPFSVVQVQTEPVTSNSQKSSANENFITAVQEESKIFSTLIKGGEAKLISRDDMGNTWILGSFTHDEIAIGYQILKPESIRLNADGNIVPNTCYWIANFDSKGTVRWIKSIRSSEKITPNQILSLKDGSTVVVGGFEKLLICGSTEIISENEGQDAFVLQFSTDGALIWAKSIGGNQEDAIYNVCQTASEDLYFTGQTTAPSKFGNIELTPPQTLGKSSSNLSDATFFLAKVSCGISDSCVTISDVKIAKSEETSLLVDWKNSLPTSKNQETTSAFELQYRKSSDDKAAIWLSKKTPQNSVVIDGLKKGEKYEFRVRRICAEGSSIFSPIISGKTLLPIISCKSPEDYTVRAVNPTKATVQWFEKAEGSVIASYQILHRKRGNKKWLVSYPNSDNPNAAKIIDLNPATEYEVRLIVICDDGFGVDTSKIKRFTTIRTEGCSVPDEVRAIHVLHKSAHVIWSSVSKAESYRVQWRKNGTDFWHNANTGLNSVALFDLEPEADYEVKVRSKCGANVFSAYSETIKFKTLSPCQPSAQILIPDITFTSAWVVWDSVPNAKKYELYYRIKSGSNAWTPLATPNRYAQLSGLNPETRYEVKLRAYCGDTIASDFNKIQEFSTKAASNCKTVENVVVAPNSDHCVVRWKPSKTATGYKIYWRLNRGNLSWNSAVISDPSINNYTIPNLTGGAPYIVRIATHCETVTQLVERTFYTQTPKINFAGGVQEPLNIYPNPIKERAKIEFNFQSDEDATLEVFDLMGRKMFTQTLTQNKGVVEINATAWESGIYFCKLFVDDEIFFIKKIIVTK